METETAAVPKETSRIHSGILVLLVLSVFINYVDRSNLSVAAPLLKDELGFTPAQIGVLLSAFFWTYAGLQLVAGASRRWGTRHGPLGKTVWFELALP